MRVARKLGRHCALARVVLVFRRRFPLNGEFFVTRHQFNEAQKRHIIEQIVSGFVSIMRFSLVWLTAENLSASASPSFSRLPNVRGGHSEIVPGLLLPVLPSNLPDAADYDA